MQLSYLQTRSFNVHMKLSTEFRLYLSRHFVGSFGRETFRVTQAWDRQVTDKECEEKRDMQNCKATSYRVILQLLSDIIFVYVFSIFRKSFHFSFLVWMPCVCRHRIEKNRRPRLSLHFVDRIFARFYALKDLESVKLLNKRNSSWIWMNCSWFFSNWMNGINWMIFLSWAFLNASKSKSSGPKATWPCWSYQGGFGARSQICAQGNTTRFVQHDLKRCKTHRRDWHAITWHYNISHVSLRRTMQRTVIIELLQIVRAHALHRFTVFKKSTVHSFLRFGTEEIATGTAKKWVQLTGTVDQVMLPGSPR